MRRMLSLSTIVLSALALVSAGAAAALLAVPTPVPPGLAVGTVPTTAPVGSQEFTDTRSVRVALSLSDPVPIRSNISGKITRSTCVPGSQLSSGTAIVSVDGAPVVVLATGVPLWRDLAPGDHGEDITALQKELQRLGHDVAADGYYGWDMRLALSEVMQASGGDLAEGGVLPLAFTAWIPSTSVIAHSCQVRVGDELGAGATLATLPSVLEAVDITNVTADTLPGARELDFGEFTLPTDVNGRVTDENTLTTLTGSRLFPELLAEAEGDGITADWSLIEPISVLAVPPGAVYALDGTSGCVQTPTGAAIPVTVVAASLGQSLISLAEGARAPEQVSLTPNESASCN